MFSWLHCAVVVRVFHRSSGLEISPVGDILLEPFLERVLDESGGAEAMFTALGDLGECLWEMSAHSFMLHAVFGLSALAMVTRPLSAEAVLSVRGPGRVDRYRT